MHRASEPGVPMPVCLRPSAWPTTNVSNQDPHAAFAPRGTRQQRPRQIGGSARNLARQSPEVASQGPRGGKQVKSRQGEHFYLEI